MPSLDAHHIMRTKQAPSVRRGKKAGGEGGRARQLRQP